VFSVSGWADVHITPLSFLRLRPPVLEATRPKEALQKNPKADLDTKNAFGPYK
jgi:hypothetical protein